MHHQLDAEFVAFTHATLGSPTISTLLHALRNGYLAKLPRLTARMVTANPPNSMATARGHLDLLRKGIQSTKLPADTPTAQLPSIAVADIDAQIPFENEVIIGTINLSSTNHSDATGHFTVTSRRGNNYVLVSIFNGYIHSEPMASRKGADYVKAYRSTFDHFKGLDISPRPSASTMKPVVFWKNTFVKSVFHYNMYHLIIIVPTKRRGPFAHSRITLLPY